MEKGQITNDPDTALMDHRKLNQGNTKHDQSLSETNQSYDKREATRNNGLETNLTLQT